MEPTLRMARLVAGNSSSAARRQVVLVGSRARGDAGPKSGPQHHIAVRPDATLWRLERRDGFLVPVSVRPFERHCEAFGDPGSVCSVVPGWGGALFGVIHDKLAASLIEEALAWMWGPLERWYDGSVTEEVPGYAEEVHKLVATLRNGNRSAATIQRSLIAVHLAPALAVHRSILYDSENRPWDHGVRRDRGEWRELQSAILGLGGKGFERTCAAALGLYGLAAEEISPYSTGGRGGGGESAGARSVGQLVDGQRGQGQSGQYLNQGEAEYRRGLDP